MLGDIPDLYVMPSTTSILVAPARKPLARWLIECAYTVQCMWDELCLLDDSLPGSRWTTWHCLGGRTIIADAYWGRPR